MGPLCHAEACSCAQPRGRSESGPESGRSTQAQATRRLAVCLVSCCRVRAQARAVCCAQPEPVQLWRACSKTRCLLSTSGEANPQTELGLLHCCLQACRPQVGLAHSLDSAGSSVASGPAEATKASYSRGAETYSTSAPSEEG